jgi:TolB protein
VPSLVEAQTDVRVNIYGTDAASALRIAIPFPQLAPPVTSREIYNPFYAPLTRAIASTEVFGIVALPPNQPPSIAIAKDTGAQLYLDLKVSREEEKVVIEARLTDVNSESTQMARRYRSSDAALTRLAYTIVDDLVRHLTGKPSVFLREITFVSSRDTTSGPRIKEIYLMSWDGSDQRRITSHESISIGPTWSPDGENIVYTSFSGGSSDLYVISRQGGGRTKLGTGLGLNTSAAFSPDGSKIAFVGSRSGNSDIYVMDANGGNIRRLTTDSSIESTPAWSPNGREISFTSSRSGSPQIYVMDAEGTNVRRISFDGEWNDDAVWAPNGELIAYTSGVKGYYQIRIMNVATKRTWIIAGTGSNEQPCWSPDGRSLLFQSNRSGKWQIYRVNPDGTGLSQLTFLGENFSPDWSWTIE